MFEVSTRFQLVRKQRHLLHSLENISLLSDQLYRTSVFWCAFMLAEDWLMHTILYMCVIHNKYLYLICIAD